MAYSTQNMYQMFDIIPNFIRKMFPLSLKTYPSCTNTMAWDIRDEIRSTYILRMVHQRDNQKAAIDDNAYGGRNVPFNMVKDGHECRSEPLPKKSSSKINTSKLRIPNSRSEHILCVTNINDIDSSNSRPSITQSITSKQWHIDHSNRQPKSIYRKSYRSSNEKLRSVCGTPRMSRQTMETLMDSTSNVDLNGKSITKHSQKSAAAKSPVQREYQLLAQKFHQYTINCRSTIQTLEKKLKKLVEDKHALLHGMVSLRKGQKDVIRKYRKIFNDAMNFCSILGAL
ncbi:uncharacterized protein LOC119086072 isoform X2 [Bradysia coprophila]|uniref:uncharacterized protein LOC119086072 isoform X2 n=1 Tax=Bradysia coprophila TaxID=38358 RepID=UPI00187DB4D3|nr:uncharacterized protein LOC119086072 isoform X2 [Bradysia coprophila]